MNFSLEQLLAFVTVFEQLSFSKAAAKLGKHRTTIGQVVTNLEDQLAVTLFERVGRAVIPTEDGHLLYHYAKQALEQARVFDKVALSLSFGGMESINFAYPSMVPPGVMSEIRTQLSLDFPMMRVNYLVRNKSEIKQGIQSGEFHFGAVNVHDSTAMHSFDSTFLGHIEFVPFVKKGSSLSKQSSDEVLLGLRNTRQFLLKSFADEDMKGKLLVSAEHEEVDQLALVIKMVEADLGWAWLPKALTDSVYGNANIEPITVDELKEGMKFGIALWCPHAKQVVGIKKSVIKAIESYVNRVKSISG
ncbi:LysR family transcriptional regulator [Alginatibacterium sediminis]|uniref:LysR family transcriptional regulator n=1 Tax=Alginatibacterium sediminis TaxID=2164068 RepID=A0A420EB26_9ALTE|nr:LysR family transcriptional regulator [Alginatibacterium sediminis]RKF17899.1 LysR family transcriptional regulator [Alginatibacterium sediminis]